MTIHQMAEKYKVPRNLAYEATFGVQRIENDDGKAMYPEDQVVKNLKILLKQRIEKRREYLEESEKMLSFIKWRETK